jgi:hypothetical protein
MPSMVHEVLVEMFRERPELAVDVLGGSLGVAVPAFERAQVSPGELTDVAPTEYRADAVVTLYKGSRPVLAVVVEVQLRGRRRKRRSWLAYVATLHARLGCRVVLLVVCPSVGAARWCARPVVVGDPGDPDLVLVPRVLGPGQVPVVADPVVARRSPELAVMSALVHAGGPDGLSVLRALLAALKVMDHDHAVLYADFVLARLPRAARRFMEAEMAIAGYQYQSDFARRYFGQGKAEGKAEGEAKGKAEGEATAVLTVLGARGIAVPDHVRARITGCTDLEQLDTWVRRAATASTVDDLFD